jgi:hypothetical protein
LLPTRVIEVGLAGDRKVRIFVNHGFFGKFAATSHRWLPGKTPKCNRDKEPQETMQGPRSQGFAQIDTRRNQTYQEVEFAIFIGQVTLYLAGFSGGLGY